MNDLAKILQVRIAAQDPKGKALSLLIGDETVEQLRAMIIELCLSCPASNNHAHCPFRIMSGLSAGSMRNLVNNLPHKSCVNLFEMELDCRSKNENPCHPAPMSSG